jgi:hypothetical protein
MVNCLLRFNPNLKVKQVLPVSWNYSLFTSIFINLTNDPCHSLLFLSMQQNKLYKIKKFLFYILRISKFKIMLKKVILYKKDTHFTFVKQIFLLFLNQFYFQLLTLIFSHILSFIPFKFRSNDVKTHLNFLTDKVLFKQNCYFLQFKLNCEFSFLVRSSFKFIKKFINDKTFIEQFLQIVYFFVYEKTYEIKNYLTEFLKLKSIFNSIFFVQFDYFSIFIITKIIVNSTQTLKLVYYKFIHFVQKALKSVSKFRFFNLKKSFFLKKKIKMTSYFSYLRVNQILIIGFSGLFFRFCFFKRQIKLFYKNMFNLNIYENLKEFFFLGFTILVLNNLKKMKSRNKYHNIKKPLHLKPLIYVIPLQQLYNAFKILGILNIQNKPKSVLSLTSFYNNNIFTWYLNFFLVFLFYYKKCSNFKNFSLKFYYICKWSLMLTLSKKHKKSLTYVLKRYVTFLSTIFLTVIKHFYTGFILNKNNKIASLLYIYFSYVL